MFLLTLLRTLYEEQTCTFPNQLGYVAYATMWNGVFFDKGSWLNLETNSYYSKDFNGFLKQIIVAGDVVSDALKGKLEI